LPVWQLMAEALRVEKAAARAAQALLHDARGKARAARGLDAAVVRGFGLALDGLVEMGLHPSHYIVLETLVGVLRVVGGGGGGGGGGGQWGVGGAVTLARRLRRAVEAVMPGVHTIKHEAYVYCIRVRASRGGRSTSRAP
jgi:hypothetical protein